MIRALITYHHLIQASLFTTRILCESLGSLYIRTKASDLVIQTGAQENTVNNGELKVRGKSKRKGNISM